MKKSKIRIFYLLLICGLFVTLCGCTNKQPVQKSFLAFDTYITITIYDKEDDRLLEECEKMCSNYEQLFSRTIESSEVSKINMAAGQPVEVSDDTFQLIQRGIYYGELSDGLFDITIAPVSELWDFHEKDGKVPEKELIEEAVSHVSYRNILLDEKNKTVKLLDNKAKIDLGGIAKGYIADKLKEFLVENDVKSALINLGGNIQAVGTKPGNTPFHIGIKKPFSDNEIFKEVDLDNKAVSSSGIYERYFYIGDTIYHHILSPYTGYPVESDLAGASIICESSTDADALSTICILLGSKEADKIIKEMNGTEVIYAYK